MAAGRLVGGKPDEVGSTVSHVCTVLNLAVCAGVVCHNCLGSLPCLSRCLGLLVLN